MTNARLSDFERLVGIQMKRLREERGWSQREVADRMKARGGPYARWLQSTVGKIENGERPLRVNELFDLAAMFGVPPDFLLDPLPEGPARDSLIDIQLANLEAAESQAREDLQRATAELEGAEAGHARARRERERASAAVADLAAQIQFWRSRKTASRETGG